jgi:hypothetical protein
MRMTDMSSNVPICLRPTCIYTRALAHATELRRVPLVPIVSIIRSK